MRISKYVAVMLSIIMCVGTVVPVSADDNVDVPMSTYEEQITTEDQIIDEEIIVDDEEILSDDLEVIEDESLISGEEIIVDDESPIMEEVISDDESATLIDVDVVAEDTVSKDASEETEIDVEEDSVLEEIADEDEAYCEDMGDSDVLQSMDAGVAERDVFHFPEGEWCDSLSDVEKYFKNRVDAGDKWMCAWVYTEDNSQIYGTLSSAVSYAISSSGELFTSHSAWGGCPMTSPYPQAWCLQIYSIEWLESYSPEEATNLKAVETAEGIKITWTPGRRMTKQMVVIMQDKAMSGSGYSVATNAGEFIYKKGLANKKYNIHIYGENDKTYTECEAVSVTTTHAGAEYSCSHTCNNVNFDWGSDYRSCNATGKCSKCGENFSVACQIYVMNYKKADFANSGYITYKATTNSPLGYKEKRVEYPMVGKVKLSYTSKAYSGSKLKPNVVVTDVNGNTIPSSFYDVVYSNNGGVGTATAQIIFRQYDSKDGLRVPYCGYATKTFKITLSKPSITKKTAKTKGFTIKYDKVPGASSYIIEYSTDKNFKNKKVKTTTKTSVTISKLKAKKKYYVRVKAVKNNVKSKYSSVVSVKTK